MDQLDEVLNCVWKRSDEGPVQIYQVQKEIVTNQDRLFVGQQTLSATVTRFQIVEIYHDGLSTFWIDGKSFDIKTTGWVAS